MVHLFRVDGDDNPEVQAVHVPRMQIRSAAFSPDGGQILMCGERSTSWGSFDLHAPRHAQERVPSATALCCHSAATVRHPGHPGAGCGALGLGCPARSSHAPLPLVCGGKWQLGVAPRMPRRRPVQAGRMDLLPGVLGRAERGFRQVIPSPDGKHLVLLGASGALLPL